jgi:hypothetical protein
MKKCSLNTGNIGNDSGIKWEFNPDRQSRSFSIEPELFKINVPKNAQIGQYSIPVLVNISTQSNFPEKFFVTSHPHRK